MAATTYTTNGNCGPYRLVRKLGSGGMGDVFLAEHRITGRRCAIKWVPTARTGDSRATKHLQAESNALRRLTHENSVTYYEDGLVDDGRPYLVMEFLPGRTLKDLVSAMGPLPQERVLSWLRPLCAVLAEVHRLGLIHRDVKPANVMVIDRDLEMDTIKLLDFGLAVSSPANSADHQAESSFSGSPHYAAPEAAQGASAMDARSDIYSLGATAYHLLVGQPVFPGTDPLAVIYAHAEQPPQPVSTVNPKVSAELEAIVMKCLAKQPDDRFQSMQELAQALSAVPMGLNEQVSGWRLPGDSSAVDGEPTDGAVTCVNLGDTK